MAGKMESPDSEFDFDDWGDLALVSRACSPSGFSADQHQEPSSDSQTDSAPQRKRGSSKRLRETSEEHITSVREKGGIYVKRRIDGRYLTYMVLPKILKTDVRRSLPQMLCNVHNSDDPRAMQDFMSDFCTKEFLFKHMFSTASQGGPAGQMRELVLEGCRSACHFWDQVVEVLPDRTCSVITAQVTVRSDGTSMLLMDLSLPGTIVLGPNGTSHLADADKQIVAYREDALKFMLSRAAARGELILGTVITAIIRSKGRLVLHLDADYLIQMWEFEIGIDS